MSKKLKRKSQKDLLPYWPPKEFIQESMKMARDKGFKGSDQLLTNLVLGAYREKRKELLHETKD